jgi:hypothetical protein
MAQSRLQNTENPYEGSYPTVFKKIDKTDVQINPFQSYKSWTVYSGSLTSSILPLTAIYSNTDMLPALGTELSLNNAQNLDGSLQLITYFSVNHLFYKYKNQPYNTFGPSDLNRTTKYLYESASLFSVPLNKIGQGIKPTSFTFTSSVSGSYSSDRYGNIINSAFNTFNQFKSAFDTDPKVEYAAAKSLMSDHIKNYGVYALGAWYQPTFAKRAMEGDKSVFNIIPRKDYGNKLKWGTDFKNKLNSYNKLAGTDYEIMKYGGQQQGGQVMDMEEDDIKQFLAAGGQLEFLD